MKSLRSSLALIAVASSLAFGGLAYSQTSPCGPDRANCEAGGGNRWIIGNSRSASGTLEVLNGQIKFGTTTFHPVGGEVALDGSNPTPVGTGLNVAIDYCTLTLKQTAAPTPTLWLTYNTTIPTINIYAWKAAAAGSSPVASTSTETVGWFCSGR